MDKHFSIIHATLGKSPGHYLRITIGKPALEKGEILITDEIFKNNTGAVPTREEVKSIFERLRESARSLGIGYVRNLDIKNP